MLHNDDSPSTSIRLFNTEHRMAASSHNSDLNSNQQYSRAKGAGNNTRSHVTSLRSFLCSSMCTPPPLSKLRPCPSYSPHNSDFGGICALWNMEHGWRLRCTHTMRSFTCVSVVVYVARKLRPCPSYSRRRDRINLVLWRSLDKGGGGTLVVRV